MSELCDNAGRNDLPLLSYRDDQPYEVPFRAVDHDEDPDGTEGVDFILGTGSVGRSDDWATDDEWEEELNELRRRDRSRAKLGGFGFRAA